MSDKRGTCPVCSSEVVIREGKHGLFIGCSSYPTCKWTTSVERWAECEEDPVEWAQDDWYRHNDPTNEILNG